MLKPSLTILLSLQLLAAGFVFANDKENKKSKHEVDWGAMVQLDGGQYGEYFSRVAKDDNFSYLRRARVFADYRYGKDWRAELKLQYTELDDDLDINDAYIEYRGFKKLRMKAGKFKQPFGLERLEGSSNRSTTERAMVSTELAPGRALGIQVQRLKKRSSISLGLFQQDDDEDEYSNTAPQSITARGTRWLKTGKGQRLHLGVSGSWTDWNDNPFRLNSRSEVNGADNIVRSARFNADQQFSLGLEAAWQRGPLLLSGEYIATQIDAKADNFGNPGTTADYSGYYLLGSYFVTGEKRKYNNGRFTGLSKKKLSDGALELVVRYSELDLRDTFNGRTIGAHANTITVGTNFHVNHHARLMLHYIIPDISGDVVHNQTDGNAVTLRLQLQF